MLGVLLAERVRPSGLVTFLQSSSYSARSCAVRHGSCEVTCQLSEERSYGTRITVSLRRSASDRNRALLGGDLGAALDRRDEVAASHARKTRRRRNAWSLHQQ